VTPIKIKKLKVGDKFILQHNNTVWEIIEIQDRGVLAVTRSSSEKPCLFEWDYLTANDVLVITEENKSCY